MGMRRSNEWAYSIPCGCMPRWRISIGLAPLLTIWDIRQFRQLELNGALRLLGSANLILGIGLSALFFLRRGALCFCGASYWALTRSMSSCFE